MTRKLRPGGITGTSRTDLDWQERAACREADPELFFSPEVEYAQQRLDREAEAKAICARCPVRTDCLEFRLADERQTDGGIWGGLDEYERWTLRKRRLRAAAARRRAA